MTSVTGTQSRGVTGPLIEELRAEKDSVYCEMVCYTLLPLISKALPVFIFGDIYVCVCV